MARLAAIVITRNEERRIRPCLQGLKGFVEQIVVVDDCSTDLTAKIAREEFGCTVVTRDSQGCFAEQRNAGADAADCDWILALDADEIYTPSVFTAIRKAISEPSHAAYEVCRLNHLLGKPLRPAIGCEYSLRLYRKDKCRFKGNVHEILVVTGSVGRIEGSILHFPAETVDAILNKGLAYNEVSARNFVEKSDIVSEKELRAQLIWKPLKVFSKQYFKKKGYRDGTYGLAWCICAVIGATVYWLKVWEFAVKLNKVGRNKTPGGNCAIK